MTYEGNRLVRGRYASRIIAMFFIGFLLQACSGKSYPDIQSIELETIALLSGSEGGGGLSLSSQIHRDSRGNFYATPLFDPGRIAVFNESGQFTGLLGHSGRGPGEMQRINLLEIGVGDTLHVFDWMLSRWSRFTPDGAFSASNQVPGRVQQAITTRAGEMILHMHLRDTSQIMRPFHHMSTDGAIVRSFGPEIQDYTERNLDLFLWNMAPAASGGIWVSQLNRYQIEHWNLKGEKVQTLQRLVEWFEPWIEVSSAEPFEAEPRPRIGGLKEDEDGRLWVLIIVAAEDWKPLTQDDLIGLGGMSTFSAVFDWIIEVLNPQDASLIARAVFDGPVQLIDGGLIAVLNEQADGLIDFEVCEARLTTQDNSMSPSRSVDSNRREKKEEWETFSTEERVYWTQQRLETLRLSVNYYAKRVNQNGQFPPDLMTLTETDPRPMFKKLPHNLISGSTTVVVGPFPTEPLNQTGAWYYDPEKGEVRLGITGPNGPVPITKWLTDIGRDVNPWRDW